MNIEVVPFEKYEFELVFNKKMDSYVLNDIDKYLYVKLNKLDKR